MCSRPRQRGERSRSGWSATAAEVFPELLAARRRDRHRHRPDLRPRSARTGTCPPASTLAEAAALRMSDPTRYVDGVPGVDGRALRGHGRIPARPAPRSSTTATTSAARRSSADSTNAFAYPGFVPAYIRDLFCEGMGPFRWVALSGDPADIAATDDAVLELFPEHRALHRWLEMAEERVAVPGTPRPDLLARLRRARSCRAGIQRTRRRRRGAGADRHRAGPPRLGFGGIALPGDRGDEATAPTPSPTGRSSTPCSTRHPVRPGLRSITAAASASASRSMPERRWWRTGRRRRRASRPGADERPGHGRDPPRRRRIRGGRGGGPGPRREDPDVGVSCELRATSYELRARIRPGSTS